jgi:hypothetical protein
MWHIYEFSLAIFIGISLTRVRYSDLTNLRKKDIQEAKSLVKEERGIVFKSVLKTLLDQIVDQKQKKIHETARENGSYSWLTALPLKSAGYVLNKTEFRDAVALRYVWKIPNLPAVCQCGEKNSNDHALVCRLGGCHIPSWCTQSRGSRVS